MRLAFDVETDGLLRGLSVVHCVVTKNLDTGEVLCYDDSGTRESVTTGLNVLSEADELWGHNIIGYDFEAIKEVYPFFEPQGKVYDTLILSRLFFMDMLNRDLRSKPANMPAQLITHFKDIDPDGAILELVVWKVPQPEIGRAHV